ncbi:MAG: hypothetical protein HC923_07585 [Myxococcales bacterium]|nr:hypothetical protein [Myxococcales bacterium]
MAKAAIDRGDSIPESCLPPELADSDLYIYLSPADGHFWRLSTCRGIGFGALGPIPWTAVDQYASVYGFSEDEVDYDDFVFIVGALDEEFLKISREQSEASARRGKMASAGGGRRASRPRS